MTFYTETYLRNHQQVNSLINYSMMLVILVGLIITLLYYYRHRLRVRYRDLSIILLLCLLFITGLQVTNIQKSNTIRQQSNQTLPFIRAVARDHHLKSNEVMINSTTLNDGIIVRFRQRDYRVNLSTNGDNYTLERAHVVNRKVHIER